MEIVQTTPIPPGTWFSELEQRLDLLMSARGHIHVRQKGSASWRFGPAAPPSQQRQIIAKLLHLAHDDVLFGLRDEWAKTIPALGQLSWPRTFAVLPQVSVAFCGFKIGRDEIDHGVQRVERLLLLLPKVDASIGTNSPTELAKREAEFDRQLDNLR